LNASHRYEVEVAKATKITGNASKAVSGQPTSEEISRLTFAKLRIVRIHTQELRNRFARLLNRGSELE
jgi:hypothetical protein